MSGLSYQRWNFVQPAIDTSVKQEVASVIALQAAMENEKERERARARKGRRLRRVLLETNLSSKTFG